MRFLLLIPIHLYWHLVPARWKNRQCIFRESCSHHVSRITKEHGFIDGFKALAYRIRNCRPGYKIKLLGDGAFQLILVSGDTVNEPDIAVSLLNPYLKAREIPTRLSADCCAQTIDARPQ